MKTPDKEYEIRNNKDTKDLSDFEMSEKIRIVSKEITQMDSELINITREIYELHKKRDKRIKYVSQLKNDLRVKRSKDKIQDDYIDL